MIDGIISISQTVFLFFGRATCHQIHERSFSLGGLTLPFCARCTGFFASIMTTTLYLLVRKRTHGNKPFSPFMAIFILLGFLPLVWDGLSSYLGFRTTTNEIRFATGVLFAYMLPAFFVLVMGFHVGKNNTTPIVKNLSEMFLLASLNVLFLLLFQWNTPLVWWLVSFALCVAQFMLLFSVGFLIFTYFFKIQSNKKKYVLSTIFSSCAIVFMSLGNPYFIKIL